MSIISDEEAEKMASKARLRIATWILAEENMGRSMDDFSGELMTKIRDGDFFEFSPSREIG